MKVIFNFELISKTDPSFDPWLTTLFDGVRQKSNSNFTIRVSKTKKNKTSTYRADNKKNRTYAIINKRSNAIRVGVFKREVPDISKYIKPPYVLVSQKDYEMGIGNQNELKALLLRVLDSENDYSKNTITKLNLSEEFDEKTNELMGGVITDMVEQDDKDGQQLVYVGSKETYAPVSAFSFSTTELNEKGASVGKFIVIDKSLHFDIFFQGEAPLYYNVNGV